MNRNRRAFILVSIFAASILSVQAATMRQASSAVMEYMKEGSQHYIQGNLKSAIIPYSKALEFEKKQPTLGKPLWYGLVDNLGIAYGITGDLKKARET